MCRFMKGRKFAKHFVSGYFGLFQRISMKATPLIKHLETKVIFVFKCSNFIFAEKHGGVRQL